jgi:hypothetical protein
MRRLLVALTVTFLVTSAGAQLEVLEKTTPAQRAGAQTSYMQTMLSLTPDQATKVSALNQRYAEKAEPVLKGSAWAMTKASALRKLQDDKEAELKPLLTPEQWTTYESGKDAMKTAVEAQLAKDVGD